MVISEKFKELEATYIEEVEKKRGGFEPMDNYCWFSVVAGYALARGFTQQESYEFADYMRSKGLAD
ncbi:hypothetical protein ACFOEK_09710 [Litoribrevibacter euphylliae]|uniref:Phage protein n=1 Tax=Litoribrevibacter euphylliae TaxID=1834034 RepID=A0ABV7HFQ3_9GAMM